MNRKCLCVLLSLLLAFGQTLAIFAEQAQQPATEPGQIQQTAAEQQMAEMEAELELSQLPLYDRYIVKLKPTNSLAAANTILSAAVEAAIPAAKQAANTQVQAVLDDKQVDETEAFDLAETPAYTVDEQSAELLTVTLTEKVDAAAFTAELSENAQIEYIQPDYTLELASEVVLDLDLSELTPAGTAVPAVTAAPEATSTPEIDIEITPEATPTPAAAPIVAVIDAGVDVAHHGLIEQMLPGYDFVNNTELVYDSSKKDEYYHGTHVAGIIAQNAPTAQILPLRVFEYGRAYTSDILRAIEYAQEHGASVVNMSFGGADDNRALREAMQERDMLFVCAAGNARTDVEEAPVYPACFDLENIISVASLNQDLGFSYYSNYGTESVDIAAVGRDVYSMWPEGEYGEMSGTSQAAAQVSAGAAEALARGDADAKAAVLARADRYTHLMNKVADGRSLNLFNVAAGVVNEGVQTVEYEDDFDVHGYAPTPEENWALFSSLPNVQVVAAGNSSYVVKSDGSVWAWGGNEYGMIGQSATTQHREYPTQIPGLSDIVQMSAFNNYCYALTSDGKVMAWGRNENGLLGNNVGSYSLPFVLETGAKYVEAGDTNSVVVKTDGTVTIRGDSQYFPNIDVSTITGVKKAEAHEGQFALLKEDGTVLSWGRLIWEGPNYGERNLTPYIQPGLNNVREIAIEFYETYMITEDNELYVGGEYNEPPVLSTNTTDVKNISTYIEQRFFVYTDGSAEAYGSNDYRQLGAGPDVELQFVPRYVPVVGVSDIEMISTSYSHALALCGDGSIWTWGRNHMGQLGLGDTEERLVPLPLTFLNAHRDGSTYEKAYVLTENSAAAPMDYSRDNWFTFTPTESGSYLIEGFGSFCPWGSFPDAYFYTTATPDLNNYSMRWDTNYSPNPWEGPIRYDYNSHFYFEPTLTAGQTYYIRVEEAPENTGYGVRVTKQERIMDLTGTTMVEMEAEDMTLYDWDREVTAKYGLTRTAGSSNGMALECQTSNSHMEDASSVYMPPLTFAMKSPYQQNYYFWVRAKATNGGQDSIWFNGGYMDGYNYNNMGIDIGTDEEPWTWTMIGARQLINGIHSIGICPREYGCIIDKILITTDPDYVPADPPQSEYQVFEMEEGTNTPYEAAGSSATFTIGADSFASGYQSVTANVTSASGNIASVDADAAPALSFSVPIDSEDAYSVWVRARNIDDSTDSVWVAVDDETYEYEYIGHAAENEWKWTRLRYGTWTEGTHTLKLIPREAGGIYDKIVVRRGNEEPSDAMVNGHAVFEMEDSAITPYTYGNGAEATFVAEQDGAASDGMALRATGTVDRVPQVNREDRATLQYNFYADQTDSYQLWIRARCDSDSENSIWLQLDDEEYRAVHLDYGLEGEDGGYMWYLAELPLDITPGAHTVKIVPREFGGLFDKMVITNQNSYATSNTAQFMLHGIYETEAENGTVTPYNKQGTTANYQSVETAGAFGGKAMRAVVTGDSDKVETVNAAETPVLSVRIDAQEDGLYTIWARVQVKSTAEDSVWYKLDKGGYRQIALPVNPSDNPSQWQWVKLDTISLGRGEHTVGLTPREAGGLIDKISVGLGESFEPGGDDPLYEPPPIRKTGIEYEQNTSSYTDLTPPSINAVHVEVLNFFKGIYRLTITDEDYSLDSRGTPFFFWSAEEGTFSEESADYKSVVFTADPGTAGRKVRVTVGIGDGLGQVSYRSLSLDGSEQQ